MLFKLGNHFVEGMEGGVRGKSAESYFSVLSKHVGKQILLQGRICFKIRTLFVVKDHKICKYNYIFKVLWSLTIRKRCMDS